MSIIIKRTLRKLIGPAVLLAAAVYSIIGFPWERKSVDDVAQGGWAVNVLGQNVEHPFLLMFVLGISLGYWVIPFVEEIITKNKKYDDFQYHFAGIGSTKSDFFRCFGIACNTYFGDKYQNHNQFLDQIEYPDWLDGSSKSLIDDVELHTSDTEPPWNFFFGLTEAIEDSRTRKNRSAETEFGLPYGEHDHLHHYRQHVFNFWEDAARKVKKGQLRYKNVKSEMNDDERLLKALALMSLSLVRQNAQPGPGASDFYQLCHRYFKESRNGEGKISKSRRSPQDG